MKKIRYIFLSVILLINFSFLLSSSYEDTLLVALAQLEPVSIIEKVSEKGYYLVQFKSGIGPVTPEIPIDVVFLNATFPTMGREPTVYSSPNTANKGGDTELAQSNLAVPVDYNIAPVQSYDLTIYNDQGNTLWHKADNPLYGISGKNFLTLGGYQGNITIAIDNISMIPSVEKTILERQSSEQITNDKTLKDSVKFNVFVGSDNIIKADPGKNQFTIHPSQNQQ